MDTGPIDCRPCAGCTEGRQHDLTGRTMRYRDAIRFSCSSEGSQYTRTIRLAACNFRFHGGLQIRQRWLAGARSVDVSKARTNWFADETSTGRDRAELRGLSRVTIAARCPAEDEFEWVLKIQQDFLP